MYILKFAELLIAAGGDPASPAGVRLTELVKELFKLTQCITLCNLTVVRALETTSLEESSADVGAGTSLPTRETWHSVMVRTVNPNLQLYHVRGGLEQCRRVKFVLPHRVSIVSPFSLQLRHALRFHSRNSTSIALLLSMCPGGWSTCSC